MANQNNSAKAAIKTYLDNRASTDPQFAVAYAKPHKSIDECFNYILSEAKKTWLLRLHDGRRGVLSRCTLL